MKAVRSTSPDSFDSFNKTLTRILFGLCIFLVVIRFVHLNYDSPLFYSGYSTSEVSDPYMYTSFARNKILYDDWDSYNYARWDSWKLSIVSGFSFLLFLVTGVSRVTANVGALALQLSGFLFFMLALGRYRPRLEVALASFLLLSTSGLFFSGRIPLLENGVIFFSGLTVWIYLRNRDRLVGVAITGALVTIIALAAKLNGVALLAPLLIDTLIRNTNSGKRSEKYKFAGVLIGGFVLCGIAYSLIVYERSPIALLEYFRNQTAAVGLTPSFSDGVTGLLSSALRYGSQNGLFRFQPMLMFFTGSGLMLVALRIGTGRLKPLNAPDRMLLFVSAWFLLGLMILIPYSYRPSRYYMPLMLPGAVLSAYALAAAFRGAFAKRFRMSKPTLLGWLSIVFCSFVIVYFSVQVESVWRQFVIIGRRFVTPLNVTAVSIGLALAATFVFATLRGIRIKGRVSWALALIAVLALVTRQADLLYAGLNSPRDPLHLQVEDLGNLLGPGAVISGTYGPAFTIDNDLRNLIHPLSGKLFEKDLFTRFPITHIAVSPSAVKIAQERYRELEEVVSVVQLWTRDGSFIIYRVPGVDYLETDFERGMDFLAVTNLDSALIYFDSFLEKNPSSFRGRWAKARTLANQLRIRLAVIMLDELSRDYEDYYLAHLLVGREFVTLYRFTRGVHYKTRALEEYERAKQLNPYVKIPKSELP